jgi:hypothetical protein
MAYEEDELTLRLSRYYKAYARQKEFHLSEKKYRLFGGAAGPGKTKALLWEAIAQALSVGGKVRANWAVNPESKQTKITEAEETHAAKHVRGR